MSGVTLYLVCVSTIMAALQPLALFGSDVSTISALQHGDTLQSPGDTSAQVFPSSQRAPPTSDSPVSWQGAWTDGEVLAPGCGRYRPDPPTPVPPKWHRPTPPTPAPPKWHRPTPPTPALPKWHRPDPSTKPKWDWPDPPTSKLYQPVPTTNRSNSDYGGSGLQDMKLQDTLQNGITRSTKTSPVLHPATPLSTPSLATPTPLSTATSPFLPAYLSCSYNRSKDPPFKPRVASLHAKDLCCHQKGTSSWDPIVNSSYNGTGALTMIVQYLQWIA